MTAELEVFVQTRWRCPVCRRSYSRRGTAVNHQEKCHDDPANRACKTCAHFDRHARWDEMCDADGGEPMDQTTGEWVLGCPVWEPRAAADLPVPALPEETPQ